MLFRNTNGICRNGVFRSTFRSGGLLFPERKSILYKLNYAWRFSARAGYKESYGDITNLYTSPYRTSFRNRIVSNGILPVERKQSYALYGEYKSTVHEFFLTLYLNYINNRSNRIFERRVEGEEVSLISLPEKNDSYNWWVNGTLSKLGDKICPFLSHWAQ